jgi:hypothetical protein
MTPFTRVPPSTRVRTYSQSAVRPAPAPGPSGGQDRSLTPPTYDVSIQLRLAELCGVTRCHRWRVGAEARAGGGWRDLDPLTWQGSGRQVKQSRLTSMRTCI